jgi:alginate O-acetyltransferase complex protein AlgI
VAFPSIAFGYFFLVVFTLAWALRRRRAARNGVLLAASYVFYASWHLHLAAWLLALSLVDWFLGEAIPRARSPRTARLLLAIGLTANVGLLAALKLYDFFRESIARVSSWVGLESHLPVLELLAPVGLSFYVFQGVGYLVDRHRGRAQLKARQDVQPATPLPDFLLFMAFFPKLLAGPICRAHELLPQIARPAPERLPQVERAMALVLSGMAKKLVLAGYLSTHLVGDAFQMPEQHGWPALVLALLGYSAEIYFDFSGYTDLARGLALLLGFELPENFRHPYAAANVGEFWRRWHMTFSRFLREYIYYPLGGSRRSRARTALNLMITMLICGLWHGATWGFVIWGLLHGSALVVHKLWRDWRKSAGNEPLVAPLLATAAGCVGTVLFCALARVFFRSDDLASAFDYLGALVRPDLNPVGLDLGVALMTALCFAQHAAGPLPFTVLVATLQRLPRPALPLCWAAAGIVLLALRPPTMTPYIYFGF